MKVKILPNCLNDVLSYIYDTSNTVNLNTIFDVRKYGDHDQYIEITSDLCHGQVAHGEWFYEYTPRVFLPEIERILDI